jgi:hypothetical protein
MINNRTAKIFTRILSAEDESELMDLDDEINNLSGEENIDEYMMLKTTLMAKSHEFALVNVIESLNQLIGEGDIEVDLEDGGPPDGQLH